MFNPEYYQRNIVNKQETNLDDQSIWLSDIPQIIFRVSHWIRHIAELKICITKYLLIENCILFSD